LSAISQLIISHRELIVQLASRNQLPAICPTREFVEIGGHIAYGFDLADAWRHGADEIDPILRGRKPSDIPYSQTEQICAGHQSQDGESTGITVPPELLAIADEVIE
jgi:putative ABC transport system substrate-binding protein